MGAWGVGSFENDDALNWVAQLDAAQGTTCLQEVLAAIVQSSDYLQSPDCCDALAAAEVVAALHRRPAPKLPKEVSAFVSRIATPPSPELLRLATEAVKRIETKSELRELWDDSLSAKQWVEDVTGLHARLT